MELGASTQNPNKPSLLPSQGGYSMPAEWEPHEATWLAWPQNPEAWADPLEAVQDIWVQMVRALCEGEKVYLIVNDEVTEKIAVGKLRAGGANLGNVSFLRIPTVDVWIRDYGPTFITRKHGENKTGLNNWVFNAWGRKYETYLQDDSVAGKMATLLQLPVFEPGLILEGGSIEVNGCGTCMSTDQCLLNPNRNPRLNRQDIEQTLMDHLGVRHFIWLGEGISGDDTDGHIDNLARFVGPTTVVCALEEDSKDENFSALKKNYVSLQGSNDQDGARLNVIPLPMPGRVDYGGSRLPASYANFYIGNEAVLVPQYGHPNDRRVVELLSSLFPKRKVVGIDCSPLIHGQGAIHCVTQQQPAP